jgi:hypothetical protein
MAFRDNKIKGIISNNTGNGIHSFGSFEYFQYTDANQTDPATNAPLVIDVATRVGFFSSNDSGSNLTEVVLSPTNITISAPNATLSNVTVWSANSILTQDRGDARYQATGNYLTSANLTWGNITGKPTFANVATSGNYNDLANTPNLSLYQLVSTNTWANLTGKPTLATVATSGNYTDLTNTPNLSLYALTASPTFTGNVTCNATLALGGNLVTSPKLQAYSETANTPAISSGNLTLNLNNGNVFGPVTLNANISNLTISNPPANGTAGSFTLLLKANGTAFTVTWPASVLWAGGTAPTLTSTANKTDVFSFVTVDGGTNYFAFKAGQNF